MPLHRYLEIGGGTHPIAHNSFEQFDIHAWPELQGYSKFHRGDARDLSRFNDETFSTVISSQTLEHFSHLEVRNVLREWWRVVALGGTLELRLPDIVGIYNDYKDGINTFDEFVERAYGAQDYEGNAHYCAFTGGEWPDFVESTLGETAKIVQLEPIADGGGFHTILNKIRCPS